MYSLIRHFFLNLTLRRCMCYGLKLASICSRNFVKKCEIERQFDFIRNTYIYKMILFLTVILTMPKYFHSHVLQDLVSIRVIYSRGDLYRKWADVHNGRMGSAHKR